MRKRFWLGLACVLILGAIAIAAWVGVRASAAREFRAAIDQAKQEIAAKQYGRAQKRLLALGDVPDPAGEIDYHIGICELYRGHFDRAFAAWKRVPPEGPFGARARLQSAMLAIGTGQFTAAEDMLQQRWALARRGCRSLFPRIAAPLPSRRTNRRCPPSHRGLLDRIG